MPTSPKLRHAVVLHASWAPTVIGPALLGVQLYNVYQRFNLPTKSLDCGTTYNGVPCLDLWIWRRATSRIVAQPSCADVSVANCFVVDLQLTLRNAVWPNHPHTQLPATDSSAPLGVLRVLVSSANTICNPDKGCSRQLLRTSVRISPPRRQPANQHYRADHK